MWFGESELDKCRRFYNGPWGLVCDNLWKRHLQIQDELNRLDPPCVPCTKRSTHYDPETKIKRCRELRKEDKEVLSLRQEIIEREKLI